MASSTRSSDAPSLSDSSRLVPGIVTALIVSDPSLNSGRNERPIDEKVEIAAASSNTEAVINKMLCRRLQSISGAYIRLRARTRIGSLARSTARACGNKYEHNTGVTVSATTSDANSAVMYAIPSGRSKAPSTPGKKKSGANTSITMIVAKTTEPRISLLASNTTEATARRSPSGNAAFCLSRRMTFSTSTTASSTSSPIAIANPPNVMLLIVNPSASRPRKAATNENGMANSVMMPARVLARKTITTSTTSRPPYVSASSRFAMATSMKSA